MTGARNFNILDNSTSKDNVMANHTEGLKIVNKTLPFHSRTMNLANELISSQNLAFFFIFFPRP